MSGIGFRNWCKKLSRDAIKMNVSSSQSQLYFLLNFNTSSYICHPPNATQRSVFTSTPWLRYLNPECEIRFNTVPGVTAFDLENYLSVVERSHKWQCPTSMKNASVYELQIDTFTQRILALLQVCSLDRPPAPSE